MPIKHCVYVIESKTHVKIGYTANLESRLSVLQTSSPYRLKEVTHYTFPSEKMAKEKERQLHKRFEDHRCGGEWFLKQPVLEALGVFSLPNTDKEALTRRNIEKMLVSHFGMTRREARVFVCGGANAVAAKTYGREVA